MKQWFRWRAVHVDILYFLLIMGCIGIQGCHRHQPVPRPGHAPSFELDLLHYCIQVGAFSQADNALRLTDSLRDKGLDAYYFIAEDGLYKVRFGDYPDKSSAMAEAERLRRIGSIEEYYIVQPHEYEFSQEDTDQNRIRQKLIATAQRFIGRPYIYGGRSDRGFDCSGLTMTVYKLNGLNLPRTSREQYQAGQSVSRKEIQPGDLVFFFTQSSHTVSHVGIYTGKDYFIHASSRDRKVRLDRLSGKYFRKRFAGARSYIR